MYQTKKVAATASSRTPRAGTSSNNNNKPPKTSSSDNNVNSVVPDTTISIDDVEIAKSSSVDLEKCDEPLVSKIDLPTSIKLNNTASSRRQQYKSLKQKRSASNLQLQPHSKTTKLHRQVSLDCDKIGMCSMLTDGNLPKRHHHHHHHFNPSTSSASTVIHQKMKNSDSELYLEIGTEGNGDGYTTKSALQLTSDQNISMTQSEKTQHQTPIRRDSSSTMSALQLPTLGGAPSSSGFLSSSKGRRHSNTNNQNAGHRQMPRSMTSVRRIKSAALETSCTPESVSAHPISVEVIDGKTIRNPSSNTAIPPPSKFLSRNPPLNLYPTSVAGQSCTSSSATTISDMNMLQHVASDLVYPIAEQGDENCARIVKSSTSCSSDDDDTDGKDDPDDEPGGNGNEDEDMTSDGGDSGLDQEEINLSDSDDEQNRNGSRSPLLDTPIQQPVIVDSAAKSKNTDHDASHQQGLSKKDESSANKSGSSDWEQTSASSKDQLIVKERSASEEKRTQWFDSLDFAFSTTESIGEISLDKSDVPSKAPEKNQQKSDENRVLSSSVSASQISGRRSLGAIPKQHGHHHRGGVAIRKLSFGEEQYPTSRMYQRTLSQRSTSDRIPENNAVQSTSTLPGMSLIRYLSNHSSSIDPPQIFLPSNNGSHLYDQYNTSFSSFRPRGQHISGEIHNRRFRFGRNNYTFDLTLQAHPQPKQNFIAVDAKAKSPTDDCEMCYDPLEISVPTSGSTSSNPNTGRLVITSGSQQNAGFIDNTDFNCFIDEQGHWMHLMNDQKVLTGHTISSNINQIQQQQHHIQTSLPTFGINNNNNNNNGPGSVNINPYSRMMLPATSAEYSLASAHSIDMIQQRNAFGEPQVRAKIYKFPIRLCGLKMGKTIKITMNRLQLLALFDKDQYVYQVLLAIFLSTLVAVLGSWVLYHQYYNDIFAFIFCFTIAGSQYSLLKSVQPDASSPIHGFNKTVTYSRPIYFCLLTSLMLVSHYASQSLIVSDDDVSDSSGNNTSPVKEIHQATIYGLMIEWREFFMSITNFLHWMILCLPIAFSIGLFPQINTFVMYFCEQVDMYIFGGNAICNLIAGFLAILRSLLACLILYGPIYGGLIESKSTQHILVSIFCGMLVPTAYHLSRSSSDFTHLFQLIKSTLLMHSDDEICAETDVASSKNDINEHSDATGNTNEGNVTPPMDDPLPKKLQSTVTIRLKNDLFVCTIMGLIFFALHTSTIFKVLQPNLNIVLHVIAILMGFVLHYIIPQIRKHQPGLCIAAPILKAHEHGLFEVNRLSKVMWFEQGFVYLSFIERNILYPLVIISAITADATKITDKFGYELGSALIVLTSLKGEIYSI